MVMLVGVFVHFTMALSIEGEQKSINQVLSECVRYVLSVVS